MPALSLLIDLARARGGCIKMWQGDGAPFVVRKSLSREAYRRLAKVNLPAGNRSHVRVRMPRRTLLVFPLLDSREPIGTIALEFAPGNEGPRGDEAERLVSLTRLLQAALSIEHSREETHKRLEEYNKIFEKAPIGIIIFDRKGKLTSINPFHTRGLRGHAAEDALTSTNVFREESIVAAGLEAPLRELLAGKSFELTNHPFTTKLMKRKVFVDVWGVPLLAQDGRIDGGIVLISNVTEKARLEQELRASRDYLENIINSIDNEVMVIDRERTIKLANRAFIHKYCPGGEPVVGRKCYEVSHGDETPCMERPDQCPAEKIFEGGESRVTVHEHGREGSRTYYEVMYSPLKDAQERVVEVIVVAKDISERVRLETEREKAREELLHVEKLAVLGKMSATVAHEIRNPLGSITLNLDLLEEEVESTGGERNPMIDELISSIRSELHRLSLLSDDYLRFTRYPKLNLSQVPLESLVESAVAPLRPQILSRGIELVVVPSGRAITVTVDEHQIVQAVRNLMRNAEEALPGKGKITITYGESGGTATIEVLDTGIGIQSRDLPVIFDPFFTTKEKGTGLGLSIVRQIAELHGGRVECESEEGKGSAFRLAFPSRPRG